MSSLEIGGTQATGFAYFYPHTPRKHFRCDDRIRITLIKSNFFLGFSITFFSLTFFFTLQKFCLCKNNFSKFTNYIHILMDEANFTDTKKNPVDVDDDSKSSSRTHNLTLFHFFYVFLLMFLLWFFFSARQKNQCTDLSVVCAKQVRRKCEQKIYIEKIRTL